MDLFQTDSNPGCGRCESRPSHRSFTYSEGGQHGGNNQQPQHQQQKDHPKTIVRSESVSEERLSDRSGNDVYRKPCHDSRKPSRTGRPERNSGDVSDLRSKQNANAEAVKHLRQYSDSVVDSATSVDDLCDNLNAASVGSEGEAQDAITTLEPRGLLAFHRVGAPYRSASFGQVDFNQGKLPCAVTLDRPSSLRTSRDLIKPITQSETDADYVYRKIYFIVIEVGEKSENVLVRN